MNEGNCAFPLYWFARSAVPGGLNNRIFSHSSGGSKSKIKVSIGLLPYEGHEGQSIGPKAGHPKMGHS